MTLYPLIFSNDFLRKELRTNLPTMTHLTTTQVPHTDAEDSEIEVIGKLTPHALTHINDAVTRGQKSMNAGLYQHRSSRADSSGRALMSSGHNPLIKIADLPGRLCVERLVCAGVLSKLDSSTYYPTHFNNSIVLRAQIVQNVIPYGSIASGWIAAWVWLGGNFPGSIDVTSSTHYHSILFGRNVRSTSRKLHSSSIVQFPHVLVTTPLRTMCDIARSDVRNVDIHTIERTLHQLACEYDITEHACIELMRTNTRQPRYSSGINLLIHSFKTLENESSESSENRENQIHISAEASTSAHTAIDTTSTTTTAVTTTVTTAAIDTVTAISTDDTERRTRTDATFRLQS